MEIRFKTGLFGLTLV